LFHQSDDDKSGSDSHGEEDDVLPEWENSGNSNLISLENSTEMLQAKRATIASRNAEARKESEKIEADHQEELRKQREINTKSINRLKRRTELVGEMRKAYLRDIVCLKHVINEQLCKDERIEVAQNWKKNDPQY